MHELPILSLWKKYKENCLEIRVSYKFPFSIKNTVSDWETTNYSMDLTMRI